MSDLTYEEKQAEIQKLLEERAKVIAGNPEFEYKSVLDKTKTPKMEVLQKTVESLGKGAVKGILDLVGGWEAFYNYLDTNGDPQAFKPRRILDTVKNITGVNLEKAPYETPYSFAAAGAPAAVTSAVGMPGIFTAGKNATTVSKVLTTPTKEFLAAGTTGTLAQQIAPESPFAQFGLQMTPFMAKGVYKGLQQHAMNPVTGEYPTVAELKMLQEVGPLTFGEASGNRLQLAKEAGVEVNPRAKEAVPFRQAQAAGVDKYLTDLFNRASSKAMDSSAATASIVKSFDNYGKGLTSVLRSDAKKDFGAAKNSGGTVSTAPVIEAVMKKLSALDPENPATQGMSTSLKRILEEFYVPEVPAQQVTSTILGPEGTPAAVKTVPGTPAQAMRIDIGRLQENLSAWGDAVYSGKADFGKGNIFEGVAPGQAKGIAMDVLRGYRDALTDAINSNVPGADKLVKARDRFSQNLSRIEEFSNRPLTKYFDVANPSELVPEDVVKKLRDAPKSQRAILIDVLQNSPDAEGILDTLRQSQFEKVLQSSASYGGAQNEPILNLKTLKDSLNNPEVSDFSFLFKTDADKARAMTALDYMGKVLQSESGAVGGGLSGGEAYAGTKALGGTTQTSSIGKILIDTYKSIVENPAAMSKFLFDEDSQKKLLEIAKGKTTMEKVIDFTTGVGKIAGQTAVRAGPMISTEAPPSESINAEDKDAQIKELLRERERLLKEGQ